MLYRGFVVYIMLLCLFIPSGESLSSNNGMISKDSIDRFFDRMELLRWAGQNQKVIDQINTFLESNFTSESFELRARNELAENFRLIGKPDYALSILRRVEKSINNDLPYSKAELVRSYLFRAKCFRSKDLVDSSEYYYLKANYLVKKYSFQNLPVHGEIWMDWAYLKTTKGDIQTALIYNLNAQNNYMKTLDQWHIKNAFVFYELASNYRNIGDFERAANYARMAEIVYNHYGRIFEQLELISKVVLANCYFDNGNFKQANLVYESVVDIYTHEIKPRHGDFIRILFNNGETLLNLGEYERSISFMERSININPLENESDSINLAFAYLALSNVESKLNQLKNSERLLNTSLSILLYYYGQKHIEVAYAYSSLGNYHEKNNNLDKALQYYQQALISAIEYYNDTNIYSNPTKLDSVPKKIAFNLLFDKARAFIKRYKAEGFDKDQVAAYELYTIVYTLIRDAANENFMEESLLEIPIYFQDDLNYGVECALNLYERTGDQVYFDHLLQFVETNKYFLLQNSIVKSIAKETLGIPDSAYQMEKGLLQKMNSIKQEINLNSFETDEKEYEARLLLLNTTIEWENVRNLWSLDKNSQFSLSDVSTVISLESIRTNLVRPNDLLLEFFNTLDTLYTIVISTEESEVLRLARSPELENQLEVYLGCMLDNGNPLSSVGFSDFVYASHYLFKKLVYQAISSIDSNYVKRLVIIPNDHLSIVPFEAFIQEPADTTYENYRALNYLSNDYIINYGYSVNILSRIKLIEPDEDKSRILAFSYSSSSKNITSRGRYDQYGELPYSAEELKNINRWISRGKFYEGKYASEAVFKLNAQNHDIIHLALHGFGDTLDMLNSHLVFREAGNESEDGQLYAHELYGLDLRETKLAVLSACETGIGKSMEGVGVYSLARGFAYAGCPSIVMSLWKVSDKSSAKLMDYFYQHIAAGLPKDEALQQAKISYIQSSDDFGAHPSNWAAFIALGNNEPLIIASAGLRWYYWVVVCLIVLTAIVGYLIYKSYK